MGPELTILCLNLGWILFFYLAVFWPLRRSSIVLITLLDLMAMILSAVVLAMRFDWEGVPFQLGFVSTNWFWFWLVTYFLIELPISFAFVLRSGIWKGFDEE